MGGRVGVGKLLSIGLLEMGGSPPIVPFDRVMFWAIALLFPLTSWATARKFRASVDWNRSYWFSCIVGAGIAAVLLVGWWLLERPYGLLRLGAPSLGGFSLAIVLSAMLASLLCMLQGRSLHRETVEVGDGPVGRIAITPRLCLQVVVVCFAEELLYRSFLVWYFESRGLALADALLASAIVFAFAHAYQGMPGVVRCIPLGYLLGVLLVGSESVISPILLHVVWNLAALRCLRPMGHKRR